ncbi:MAG: hypothetical protein WC466_01345, partial [Candidatus Izemoplasmatales bacterium]
MKYTRKLFLMFFFSVITALMLVGCNGTPTTASPTTAAPTTAAPTTAAPTTQAPTTQAPTTQTPTTNAQTTVAQNPIITQTSDEYDVGIGGDYIVTVNLNGGTWSNLRMDSLIVDTSEYLFNATTGELKILEIYMMYLEYDVYTFRVTTSLGYTEFDVEVLNSIQTSFDADNSRDYVYGSLADVTFTANFTGTTITHVKMEGETLDPSNYSYADGSFTLTGEFCDSVIWATKNFEITLSNNDAYTFSVTSDCLFQLDMEFETDFIYSGWLNVVVPQVVPSWDGNGLSYVGYGSGGNLLIFDNIDSGVGYKLPWETGAIYKLSFEVQNLWDEETDPWGTVNFNTFDASGGVNVFSLNYVTEEHYGGSVIKDPETGVYTVEFYFPAPLDNGYTLMYCGYDPSNASQKLCDLIFDNFKITKADTVTPEIITTSVTYKPGTTTDTWISGLYGDASITSVAIKDGAVIDPTNYKAWASTLMLKGSYLDTLTDTTTYVITLSNTQTVEFTVNLDFSVPTTFDENNVRNVEYADIKSLIFDAGFGAFDLAGVYLGETLIPERYYTYTATSFTLYRSFIETLTGTNVFTIEVENAGMIEGKTENETHEFTVISNLMYAEDFEDGFDGNLSFISNTDESINVTGIDGASLQLTSTGGNTLVFGPETSVWNSTHGFGQITVPFVESKWYQLSFDIKDLATVDPAVTFVLHGLTEANFHFVSGDLVDMLNNNTLIIQDNGDGSYRLTYTFLYAPSVNNALGTVTLEMSGYQTYYYDILLDNVALIEFVPQYEAKYVFDSNEDVVFPVDFVSMESIMVNDVALESANYTLANHQLIIDGAYCQGILGQVEIVVSVGLEDVRTFTITSTKLFEEDFEGTFDPGLLGTVGEHTTSTGIDGLALDISSTGGNMLVLGTENNGWYTNLTVPHGLQQVILPFNTTSHYQLTFDIQYVGVAPIDLEFYLHGALKDGRFAWNAEGVLYDKNNNETLTIVALGEGVYRITFDFMYSLSSYNNFGVISLEANGWQTIFYNILIDNISVNEVIVPYVDPEENAVIPDPVIAYDDVLIFSEDFEDTYDPGLLGTVGEQSTSTGFDGLALDISSTGGNILVLGTLENKWKTDLTDELGIQQVILPFNTTSHYKLAFDIKYVGTPPVELTMTLHGALKDANFGWNAEGVVFDKSPNGSLTIQDLGEGVYRVTFDFMYSLASYQNWGVISLEASGWNTIFYNILIDNVKVYELVEFQDTLYQEDFEATWEAGLLGTVGTQTTASSHDGMGLQIDSTGGNMLVFGTEGNGWYTNLTVPHGLQQVILP